MDELREDAGRSYHIEKGGKSRCAIENTRLLKEYETKQVRETFAVGIIEPKEWETYRPVTKVDQVALQEQYVQFVRKRKISRAKSK